MRISIIGTGYVGLVTGTCLVNFGLQVTCVDKDNEKIQQLNNKNISISEPHLEDLIEKNVKEKHLFFSTNIKKVVGKSQVIFITVETPPNHDGSANLKQIEEVAQEIAFSINNYKIIVIKSTAPVGTTRKIKEIINKYQPKSVIPGASSVIPTEAGIHPSSPSPSSRDSSSYPSPLRGEGGVRVKYSFDLVSNPEFLREGSAVYDFTHPDKIVIGYENDKAKQIMQEIYRLLYLIDTPFIFTTTETAELIKYACNAFLATKITFINEIANLCEKVGADVHHIVQAMGLDGRISPKFLHLGPGYGGSCFPKDTEALCSIATSYGYEFKTLQTVISENKRQRELMVEKIKHLLGDLKDKTIGVLGLAFKQNTDDICQSPSIDIIQLLLKEGVQIRCFDPLAMENTKKILPDLIYCQDEYETVQGSDALVIATEWNQFRNLDLLKIKKLLKTPILIDLRNLYDPTALKSLSFVYEGVGGR